MKNQVYRKDGYVYVVKHKERTVLVPSLVDEGDYPPEVLNELKVSKYYKQIKKSNKI